MVTMSLYGLATLFTELIPKFQVGLVEFSVEYLLFIPLTLAIAFDPLSAALVIEGNEWLGPDGVEVLKTLHRMKKAYGGQL